MSRIGIAAAITVATLASAPAARGAAEGPATPQAVAAHAEFLATWPAPPTGAAAVCVIDSGVDTDTDLGPALGARSAFDGGTPNDTGAHSDRPDVSYDKHGTYVAGVIGSQIDGVGTNGIWPAAKVISRRVFAGPDSGTTAADYINAIDWCVNQTEFDVKVINLSISGLSATLSETANLNNRIAIARNIDDVTVVAAAGNSGLGYVGYPASAPGVFAVGATDANAAFWPDSNRGMGLDISAFGVGTCLTSAYGTRLAVGSGTSYAAPVVSAVLGALRSLRPDLGADQAERYLLDNATNAAAGKTLNAAKAFASAGVLTDDQAARMYSSNPCEPAPISSGDGAASAGGDNGGAGAPGALADAMAGRTEEMTVQARGPGDELPAHPSAGLKPTKPLLRSVTYRAGVLTVRVSGYRTGQRAIFSVERRVTGNGANRRTNTRTRTYTRWSGILRVQVNGWTRVHVRLRTPGVGTSQALTIRRLREL